jgi:hypothetical protein
MSTKFVLKSNRFLKDIDTFAHMINIQNTSSMQRVVASSSKQGGVAKITRKNSNTSNNQKIWATF